MTASTNVGEGEKTRAITVPPNNKVPARIISFSRSIESPWKENLILPCQKVGLPSPITIWRQEAQAMETNARRTIAKNGTLIIRDCMSSDEGNYTCAVENTWGQDEIIYNIVIKVPPDPPVLRVVNSFSESLKLEWIDNKNGGSSILGYVINFKRENGDWEELQIESKTNYHLLGNLWCGTKYQLYITSYNKIGTGLPGDIVNAHTTGGIPIYPKQTQSITNNATSVTCWLDSWGGNCRLSNLSLISAAQKISLFCPVLSDGGCGISHFVIEYKLQSRSQWNMVASHIAPTERIYTVSELHPDTKYQLRVTAYNNAGSTSAIYNLTTSMLQES